jgi:hypothetical protein
MVNVVRVVPFRRDMHCAHAHRVRCCEIADIILEHGGGVRLDPVALKNGLERSPFWFGAKLSVLNPVNRIKQV